MLCQLSYRGRQPADCSRGFRGAPRGEEGSARAKGRMCRFAVFGVALFVGVLARPPGARRQRPVAALQVGLRAHGYSPGPVDGVRGPQTTSALVAFQRAKGLRPTGLAAGDTARARRARAPLLGRRELAVGAVGWDVAVLEFRLRRYGLAARAVDGRFTRALRALRRYQRRHGLVAGRDRRGRRRIGRSPAAPRSACDSTSCSGERASSRSRRATA